jgi:cerevisin
MGFKKGFFITALWFSSVAAAPFYSSEIKLAPLYSAIDAEVIPSQYIVVFKNDIVSEKIDFHHHCLRNFVDDERDFFAKRGINHKEKLVSGIRYTYNFENLKGYAGRFSEDVLLKIRQSEEVAYVEKDQIVYTSEIQRNAPWGLARIAHRPPLSFGTFNKYSYDSVAGEGVTVYIVDTGININHTDFEGRAKWGITIPDGDEDVDGNGHGTHVAGTVAGKRYGVSKKANVVAVKVLRSNGSGTMSDVIKGVEWVAEAHVDSVNSARRKGTVHKGSGANMSLGGGRSRTLDAAVNGAVNAGVHFAVAAGNDNRDACDYSPAAAEKAITVGASTIEDERAWFSNFGPCVDVFGPGKDITSTWIGSRVATNTISGTSMASPHVAGLVAYFLSLQPSSDSEYFVGLMTPKELKDKIIKLSTKNAMTKIPSNTPNLLIFNDYQNN